jgi:hypothetical protein
MFKKNVELGFDFNWDRIPADSHFLRTIQYIKDLNINMDNFCVVNGLPIYFNKNDKIFNINLSGGADSTLLTYILCKLISEHKLNIKIIATTLIRFWEYRSGTEDAARNIFNIIQSMFPDIEMEQVFGFVPTALEVTPLKNIVLPPNAFGEFFKENANADVYAVMNFTDYVNKRNKVNRTYSGTTTNPDHLGTSVNAPEFRRVREFMDSDNHSYLRNTVRQDPFFLIQKNWVMAQYENFGITSLRDATRSCESTDIVLNSMFGVGQWDSTNAKYSCGKCFFCQERAWGIDSTDIFLEGYHK